MRKVLMLHGYAQNANIFRQRVSALRKACAKDIEFVFVDGPIVLQPVDIPSNWGTPLSELGAPEAAAADSDPSLTPRGWWRASPDRATVDGLEDSIALLRDMLKEGEYDGVFGFSQGAAMATILAAVLEKPHLYPPFLIDGQPPHPPLKFCISVAGFKPSGELCQALFTPSYSTRTLHVLGKNDVIVVEERSKTILDVSANKRVEWHDGGHFVPSKANWRNFLRDYMKDPEGNAPSPAPGPASGTATPTGSGPS